MRNLLSGEDKFNEVRLLRDVFSGSVLLLEGPTDCSVMDNFIDSTKCRTIPALTKQNVLDAVALADKTGFRGTLGVVDADFDRLNKSASASPNICITDHHDLDLTILLSGVLQRLLPQYCDRDKHDTFLNSIRPKSLLDVLLESAGIVGLLKWISQQQRLDLNFQVLNFALFLDKATLWISRSDLIRAVIDDTRSCRATASSLVGDMGKAAVRKPDPRQLANGHDVIEILSIALRFTVGRCKPDVADPRNVEKMCRMAFAASDLQLTQLYKSLKDWEFRNAPYVVLKY